MTFAAVCQPGEGYPWRLVYAGSETECQRRVQRVRIKGGAWCEVVRSDGATVHSRRGPRPPVTRYFKERK